MQQDYIARRSVSRELFFLGAAEVLLGVLLFFEIAELPPLPFTDSRLPEVLGVAAAYYGAYLLYWGGTLWQQSGDAEQWRQTVSRIMGKLSSHPVLSAAVLAGVVLAEWAIWGTVNSVAALLEAGALTLLFLPLLGKLRRL